MLHRALAIVLLATSLGSAQDKVVRIPASFYAFDYVPGHETVFYRSAAEAFEEIALSRANIVGPVYAVVVNGAIQLHAEETPAPDGSTHRPLLAAAKVRPGLQRALVVLFPNPPKSATPYRALVFEHNQRAFPLGTYRIINLAPHAIRGAIGSQVVQAKPGDVADLKLSGTPGAIVPVRFEFFDNGTWNLLTETRCAIRKDRRWLMCIYKDPISGRLNMRSIPDRTQPPAVPAD